MQYIRMESNCRNNCGPINGLIFTCLSIHTCMFNALRYSANRITTGQPIHVTRKRLLNWIPSSPRIASHRARAHFIGSIQVHYNRNHEKSNNIGLATNVSSYSEVSCANTWLSSVRLHSLPSALSYLSIRLIPLRYLFVLATNWTVCHVYCRISQAEMAL